MSRFMLFVVGISLWTSVGSAPGILVAQELRVLSRQDILVGQALREPALVQLSDGTLFAAGYSRDPEEALDPPNLYRSGDLGRTWTQVDVGTVEEGALGNSDVDLKVGPDGSIYFLAMGFDRSVGEGTHVTLGISRDAGETWTWRYISQSRFDDRPWIGLTPDGRSHVVWNDGEGVRHATSSDLGDTWVEGDRISKSGGSSHLAIGPSGEIAVRIVPWSASGQRIDPAADHIGVSLDDGQSWTLQPAPGERDWEDGLPRWVEPVAWDQLGRLYSFWSEGTVLRLGISEDKGATWEIHDVVQDRAWLFYPLLGAGPDGSLVASWFSASEDAPLHAHVALIDPSAESPVMRMTQPIEVDSWGPQGRAAGAQDPGGEYFPVILLMDGGLGAILPIQNSEKGDGFSWLRIGR